MAASNDIWEEWTYCMEQMRKDDGIPGLAIAMIRDRTTPLFTGLGVRDQRSKQPVTENTIFHIASTQKSMTAMYIATLVDDGIVTWDTPAAEIVPQFRMRDEAASRRITLRHLLGMSSGIPAAAQDDFERRAKRAEDLFEFMPSVTLQSNPGEQFDYSNLSCAAAGFCGVVAGGGTWGRLEDDFAGQMTQRIFKPIGMSHTTFSADTARTTGDFAVSHKKAMLWGTNVADEVIAHPDPLSPAGGVRSSISDMARFLYTQLNGGISPDGQRVVSQANLEETWRPQARDPEGNGYAMGWGVEMEGDMRIIFHEGNFAGYVALLAMIPERGTGIAMLANMDNDDGFANAAMSEWLTLQQDGS